VLPYTASIISIYAKKPEISADRFESIDGKQVAIGNATLIANEVEVHADTLTFDAPNNTVSAKGKVSGTFPAGRVVSQEVTYNILNKSVSAKYFRIGRTSGFLKGEKLSGSMEQFTAENATLYYNEPDFMGINTTAKKITYTQPHTVKVEDAVFRIGQLPVFYLPSYTQNNFSSPIDLKTKGGYNKNLGAYMHNKIYLPHINKSIQPGAELGYYSKRGTLAGPAARYNIDTPGDMNTKGEIHSGFINDHGNKGVDIKGKAIKENRHYVEWQNKGNINEDTTLTGKLSWWKDSETLRDFQHDLWKDNQEPDNFLEGVYSRENYFISAFTRANPNDWQRVQTRTPEIRLDVMPVEIMDSNAWLDMHTSVASLYEKDPNGLIAEKESNRGDLYLGVRSPYKQGNLFTITPVAGSRITHYEKTVAANDTYTRALGQIGFDATTSANRTWNYNNETWSVDGLRHVINPMIQYRYIPEAEKGNSKIPQIDRQFSSTLLPSIDLGEIRNVDELHELNVLRFGAGNALQTKDPEYGSRTLAKLDVFQDYNFNKTPSDNNNLSDLHTEAGLTPVHWFGFDVYNRFDTENMVNEEVRTRAKISNGDVWALFLTTDNLQNNLDQYYVDYQLKLTERYYFIPRFRFDTEQNKISQQVYGLRTYLGNTWEVEYAISLTEGSSREDGLGFSVKLNVGSF
jgi:LPS-assembly protein